mmetsp:Transcript_8566/g.31869  ORF Transcript_8566/g.31869 Transcript_8566/m.31869 type:complete len:257 (+) Transcript_8566:1909-2679(+)
MPPMREPVMEMRLKRNLAHDDATGAICKPIITNVPLVASKSEYISASWHAEIVSKIKSIDPAAAFMAFSSVLTKNSCAPMAFASASLSGEREMAMTVAPMAAAILMPICPRPPTPAIPTRMPGLQSNALSGSYMVIPAHKRGALLSSGASAGTLMAKFSFTTILFEYPPIVGFPFGPARPYCVTPPYVNVLPVAQYCSSSCAQNLQLLHESTMHPTPILSPTLNLVTFFPTLVTVPINSCPGVKGYIVFPRSFSTK